MTSYCLYNFIAINLADVSRNFKFSVEFESTYQGLSNNVLFVTFYQVNGKLWLVFIVSTF